MNSITHPCKCFKKHTKIQVSFTLTVQLSFLDPFFLHCVLFLNCIHTSLSKFNFIAPDKQTAWSDKVWSLGLTIVRTAKRRKKQKRDTTIYHSPALTPQSCLSVHLSASVCVCVFFASSPSPIPPG